MTRVITLGTIVSIACGAVLGLTLAYGQWMLAVGALILGVGGAMAVALTTPEPAPAFVPVTLGGPVVRPTIESDAEPTTPPGPDRTPYEIPASPPGLLAADPDRTIPNAA